MKIACIQLSIKWENPKSNFNNAKILIKEAKDKGAEFIFLPELFSTGVTMNSSKFAESINGKTCKFLSEQASSNNIFLLGTFIEKNSKNLPKNSLVIFNPQGNLIGKYSKLHIFSFGGEKKSYSNGDDLTIIKINEFKFAPFICYDLRFPEIFRIAVGKGANVFVLPSNWPNPRKEHWTTLLRARAIENESYVIGINRVGTAPNLTFFGSSMIISPKGEIIAQADDKERVLIGDININEVNQWRKSFGALKDRRKEFITKDLKSIETIGIA